MIQQIEKRVVRHALMCLFAVSLTVASGTQTATAGGGPENVFLVVNPRSWASRTVANHFIALRQIPPDNVMYLDWAEDNDVVKIEDFRNDILTPVLAAIDARGLAPQIDYIVYSSDFPYRVNYREDLPREEKHTLASLNGLTFLAPLVLKKDTGYKGLGTNHYMGSRHPVFGRGNAYGFRSGYGWDHHGERVENGGQHYYLSTMLAITSGRGNSVPEAISYLHRAAAADGRRPAGTVYFVKNDDIRSKTREPGFQVAVDLLSKLGVAAEIVPGILPTGKDDVRGAMIGARGFQWKNSGSTILPGAICEHFTSYGGVMHPNSSQTPLSEFLRHGAAGASGTVIEPLAIQAKFPVPLLHSYYAQGCTLAEAFYQSVMGPYQLLIVGDPLCRPWARIPDVTVEGVPEGGIVKGTLTLTPSGQVQGAQLNHFELFVDGRRQAICRPGDNFQLDTTGWADGYHELRVVAVASRPIETQGRFAFPIWVANGNRAVSLESSERETAVWNDPIVVTAAAHGAARIEVFHNSRLLGVLDGAEGRLSIDPKDFGHGPVSLHAIARFETGGAGSARSRPLQLTVKPDAPKPGGRAPATGAPRPGLQLRVGRQPPVPIQRTAKSVWLEEAGVGKQQDFRLTGSFEIATADVYQFHARHVGAVAIAVDGVKVYEGTELERWDQAYIPLSLGPGLHTLQVDGRSERTAPRLDLRFGNVGVTTVDGRGFRH